MRVGDSKNKSFKPYFPVVVFIGLNDETGFFYSQKHIQANVAGVDFRLWVIESDADVRNFVLEADKVLDSDAFKGLFAAVEATLAVAFPTLSGVIAVSGVAVSLLRRKLRANKDDLVEISEYKQAVRIFELQRFGRPQSITFKNGMPMKQNRMNE